MHDRPVTRRVTCAPAICLSLLIQELVDSEVRLYRASEKEEGKKYNHLFTISPSLVAWLVVPGPVDLKIAAATRRPAEDANNEGEGVRSIAHMRRPLPCTLKTLCKDIGLPSHCYSASKKIGK